MGVDTTVRPTQRSSELPPVEAVWFETCRPLRRRAPAGNTVTQDGHCAHKIHSNVTCIQTAKSRAEEVKWPALVSSESMLANCEEYPVICIVCD